MGKSSSRSDLTPGLAPTAPASGARGHYPANDRRRADELARATNTAARLIAGEEARNASAALHEIASSLRDLAREHTAAGLANYVARIEALADSLTVLEYSVKNAGESDGGILFDVRAWMRVPDPLGATRWAVELEVIARRMTSRSGGHRG